MPAGVAVAAAPVHQETELTTADDSVGVSLVRVVVIGTDAGQEYWIRLALRDSRLRHDLVTFDTELTAIPGIAVLPEKIDTLFLNSRPAMLELSETLQALRGLPQLALTNFVVLVVDCIEQRRLPIGCEAMMMMCEPSEIRYRVGPGHVR